MSWTPPRTLPPVEEWRTQEAVQCLECGIWKRALGKHVKAAHDMTAAEYRKRWGMRQRQPLSCGDVSDARRKIAIESGGVERLTAYLPLVSDKAHEAAKTREHRPQEIASTVEVMRPRMLAKYAAAREEIKRRIESDTGKTFSDWARSRYLVELLPIRVLADEADIPEWMMKRLLLEDGVKLRPTGPLKGVLAKGLTGKKQTSDKRPLM